MTYKTNVPARSDSTWIALAAAARGPWSLALAGGAIVGVADLGWHLLTLSFTIATPLSLGLTVFFLIGGAGALLSKGSDRAHKWAVDHPWTYALVPAVGTAATVSAARLLLSMDGFFGSVFNGLWSAAAVLLIVGVVGYLARAVRPGR